MIKYIIRKENDILYYNNGEWVSKDKAEEFDWYNADNTARELIHDGVKVVIESKWSDDFNGEKESWFYEYRNNKGKIDRMVLPNGKF